MELIGCKTLHPIVLLIKDAKYDFTNNRWNILADLKQSNIAES